MMKLKKRLFGLVLACAILGSALPAMAAADDTLVQVNSNSTTYLYTEASTKSEKIQRLAKGALLYVLDEEGAFYKTQTGNVVGYTQKKACKAASVSSASAQGALRIHKKTTLYEAPSSSSKKLSTLEKDGLVDLLLPVGDYVYVCYNGLAGFVEAGKTEPVDANASVAGYARLSANASALQSASSGSKTLVRLQKNQIVSVVGASGSNTIIQYNKQLGYVKSSALETVALKTLPAEEKTNTSSSLKVYSGPSSKYSKLGTLKKNAQVQVIGKVGSYSIILYNDVPGYVATKSLKAVTSTVDTTGANDTNGPITTNYVECNTMTVVYKGPGTKYGTYGNIYDGSIMQYYGEENGWVCVDYGGARGYIQRKYITESTFSPSDAVKASTYDAAVAEFIALTNAYRKQDGKKTLATDATLTAAAQVRVQEIAILFDHTRPNGRDPSSLHSSIRAENIAKGTALLTPASAAKGFMSSQGHRESILYKSHTKTGAAVLKIGSVYYWVQLFG